MSLSESLDPLAPDAPIHQLLSIKHNKLLKDLSIEELTAKVTELRTLATSAPTLTAKLQRESDTIAKKPRNVAAAKRKALLDEI
jgi:hypothetical protein